MPLCLVPAASFPSSPPGSCHDPTHTKLVRDGHPIPPRAVAATLRQYWNLPETEEEIGGG